MVQPDSPNEKQMHRKLMVLQSVIKKAYNCI